MNKLRLLAEQVSQWWQTVARVLSQTFFQQAVSQPARFVWASANQRCQPWVQFLRKSLSIEGVSSSLLETGHSSLRRSTKLANRSAGRHFISRHTPFNQTQVAIVLALVVLTAALGQRFYNQPGLGVNDLSSETFFAPETITLVDEQTTEENRKAARNGAVQVLVPDEDLTLSIERQAQDLLEQGSSIRNLIDDLPFLPTSTLSTVTQRYLRQTSNLEWQAVWDLAQNPSITLDFLQLGNPLGGSLQGQLNNLNLEQKQALAELLRYRHQARPQALTVLGHQIQTDRWQYQAALAKLAALVTPSGLAPLDAQIFELSDAEWATVQSAVKLVAHRMLIQGIHPGMPEDLMLQAIQVQLQGTLPLKHGRLAANLLSTVLRPNLTEDAERTRLRAEKEVKAVEPVMVSIEREQVIVNRGEKITQAQFVLLDHFNFSRRHFDRLGFVSFGVLIGFSIGLFLWVDHAQSAGLRSRDHLLVVLLILSVAALAALKLSTLALPALGLLMGSFYGTALTTTTIGLLMLALLLGANVGAIPLLAGGLAALVGAAIAPRLRSREELALLGGAVGLTQGIVYLLLTLMFSPVSASAWYNLFISTALQGVYGLVWSIVALGLSPYLESVFDIITPIRLAEFANPNRPLLKRLAAETPGTFQHTMFVANLGEAAAKALGLNVELVRAGTLYHDIGKMHDPLGFIENQMGGPNKHDAINDPWVSADIIKKHVTLGLKMARKHRLPAAIQAFIPEHQGTMLVGYFYHQAQEIARENPNLHIDEADFRYDGPIPQSPETGIVMLADSCEAALRSLHKEATPEEAYSMVNKILRARWKDGQLVDSCLSRADMDVITNIFVQVWQQYNHKRIAYPKAVLAIR